MYSTAKQRNAAGEPFPSQPVGTGLFCAALRCSSVMYGRYISFVAPSPAQKILGRGPSGIRREVLVLINFVRQQGSASLALQGQGFIWIVYGLAGIDWIPRGHLH